MDHFAAKCRAVPFWIGGSHVPYFALLYDLGDDYLPRRAALRAEHLALAQQSFARGERVLGGAFADPTDTA
jgi:hypothetical protein